MRENENEYYMQPEVMKGRVEIEMAFEIETNITKKSKSLDFPCIFDFFSLLIIILIEINVNIHNDLMFIRLIQFYGNNQHENNIQWNGRKLECLWRSQSKYFDVNDRL